MSGGSTQTQFLVKGSFQRQTNVFRFDDSAFRRFSGLMNLNHTSSDNRLKASISVTYNIVTNNQNGGNLMEQALTLAPNAPALFNESGDLNFENNFNNPVAFLQQEYENNNRSLTSSMSLDYELLEGLNLSTSFGYTDNRLTEISIRPLRSLRPENRAAQGGSSNLTYSSVETWIVEPQIDYRKKIGKGELRASLGATFQSSENQSGWFAGSEYDSDLLIRDISQAPVLVVNTNDFSEYRYSALYARLNYNYKNRYILNLTGRRDGSSRFGPGRQFGNFGAVGATWIFSEEAFLKGSNLLSFGKLRASFGTVGNDQIGNYGFLDTFQGTFLDYNGSSGLVASRAANPNYSWEESKKLEFGLELGLFRNRVQVNTSWFRNRSSNQLINRVLSAVTGFTTVQFNRPALVENWGWELELSTINLRTDNFQWTSAFNISRLRNELVDFPGIENFAVFNNRYIVGRSLFGRKQYRSLGVNPQTGEYTIVDVNGDGRDTGIQDRQDFVEVFQDYFGGLNNSFRWKGLQLNVFISFVRQNARDFLSNFGSAGTTGIDNRSNQPVRVLDRWQMPGDVTTIQRFTTDVQLGDSHSRNYVSNNGVVDASFIRLQNVSLSWTLPQKLTEQLGLESLRIYANGQNLATFTGYQGLDPETQGRALPPLRIITTGIQLTF